jgi:hypothetical protein
MRDMKRQRGRGRKPGGNQGNRSFESNGPEVKIRGNPSQIYDKYLQLARDASTAGDPVRAENLYQHAEHYYRIVQANQPKPNPNANQNANSEEQSSEASDGNAQESGDQNQRDNREHREPRRGRDRNRNRNEHPRREPREQRDQNEQRDPMAVVTPDSVVPEDIPSQGAGETPAVETPVVAAQTETPTPTGDAPRRTRRPRRTKAEMAASREAEAAMANSGNNISDDGDKPGGGDETAAA